MNTGLITILMFGLMLFLLMLGLPIVFVLGGTAIVFALFAWGPASTTVLVFYANDLMHSSTLVAVALFIFMAYMLEQSGIAEDLYELMYRWMGALRGGLAAGTIFCSTIVAAMSGISTTGVVLMGIIGLPAMLKRKYHKTIAIGSIMAGGTLGPLIPPSLLMIVYGLISGISVGKLFLGGVLPGLTLSILFIGYILIRCYLNPNLGPPLAKEERATWAEKYRTLKGVVIPILLVIGVLGTMFFGIATPTEASSVGAFGAIVSAAIHRKLSWINLKSVAFRTLKTVAMVMWVIYAAGCFASICQGLGISSLIEDVITSWQVSKWVIMALIQFTWLVMGCLMDSVSILMVTSSIFFPIAKSLEFDPLWLGILFVINSEMDLITPPFGVNLVVMRGLAPQSVTMGDIYRSSLPFVGLQIICLILVILFPALALWLPDLIFAK